MKIFNDVLFYFTLNRICPSRSMNGVSYKFSAIAICTISILASWLKPLLRWSVPKEIKRWTGNNPHKQHESHTQTHDSFGKKNTILTQWHPLFVLDWILSRCFNANETNRIIFSYRLRTCKRPSPLSNGEVPMESLSILTGWCWTKNMGKTSKSSICS